MYNQNILFIIIKRYNNLQQLLYLSKEYMNTRCCSYEYSWLVYIYLYKIQVKIFAIDTDFHIIKERNKTTFDHLKCSYNYCNWLRRSSRKRDNKWHSVRNLSLFFSTWISGKPITLYFIHWSLAIYIYIVWYILSFIYPIIFYKKERSCSVALGSWTYNTTCLQMYYWQTYYSKVYRDSDTQGFYKREL